MVSRLALLFWAVLVQVPLAAAAEAEPAAKPIDPVVRAKALMAILGIVLLGVVLITCTWLAGRYVQRIARSRPRPPRSSDDDWFRKTMQPPDSTSGPVSPGS